VSTDILPEIQTPVKQQTPTEVEPVSLRDGVKPASHSKWWKVCMVVGVAVMASAVAIVPGLLSTPDAGTELTHTITRGDLVVSVIEQGTLESSNNTEILCKVRGFSTVTWVVEGGTFVQPGDELVRLDTKLIEEQLSRTKTSTFEAMSMLERTRADAEKAEIAIDAYVKGRYRSELQGLERQAEVAERNLRVAEKMQAYSNTLFQQGYVTELEVEANAYSLEQAKLVLEVNRTQINVLKEYKKQMQMETMQGNLKATTTKVQSDEAALRMEESRKTRVMQELEDCVITAERSGLVIYPTAEAWKETPDISQGVTVRKDQVLLLMPDLSKMQVKVGIHESIIDRVKPGLTARITMPDQTLEAKVTTVASVTRPAGWWTGNVVKYDTIIELPEAERLKPGMSAEVEVIMARHEDVITIPIAAVVATEKGDICWVKTAEGTQQRLLKLSDTNDVSIVVEDGVLEGDEVILNPLAHIKEAQDEALKTLDDRLGNADDADNEVDTEAGSK
jgi:HlyD family secretion protein